MDIRKYWDDVRAEMARLEPKRIYHVVSIDNSDKGVIGGRVMDMADPKQVARRLVERTHRLATEKEIVQFEADEAKAKADLEAIAMEKKGQLAMPQELQDLVRLAAKGASQEQASPTNKKEK